MLNVVSNTNLNVDCHKETLTIMCHILIVHEKVRPRANSNIFLFIVQSERNTWSSPFLYDSQRLNLDLRIIFLGFDITGGLNS